MTCASYLLAFNNIYCRFEANKSELHSPIQFLANGTNVVDGAGLIALQGAQLSLPGLTRYDTPDADGRNFYWGADGPGSVLDLPNLPAMTGSTAYNYWLHIEALNGGTINLSKVTQTTDPTGGDNNNGILLLSKGADSTINLCSLSSFVDQSSTPRSELTVVENGVVLAGASTVYSGVSKVVNTGGQIVICDLGTAPSITLQAVDQTKVEGETLSLTVTASGTAPLVYRWQKNGANLANDGRITGADTAQLSISSLTTADSGLYQAFVSNAAGQTNSRAASVTINTVVTPPQIAQQPQSRTNTVGSTATFSVTATGDSPFSYQWQFNGANLANGGRITGATTNLLTLTSADDRCRSVPGHCEQ